MGRSSSFLSSPDSDDSSSSSYSSSSSDSDDDINFIIEASRRRRSHKHRHRKHTKNTSTKRPAEGVARKDDSIWPHDKRYLKVRFMDGSPEEKQLVESLIVKYYNVIPMRIRFRFLKPNDPGSSDIRITFKCWGRPSSFVGRENETIAIDKPTMKLNMKRGHDQVQSDILHEFGHALGLEHEQKNPNCKLEFNRSALKRDGYNDDSIDRDYGKSRVVGNRITPYDIHSIMHYPVKKGHTVNGNTEIGLNTVLSQGDRQFLVELYPADPEPKYKHKHKHKDKPKSKLSEPVLVTEPTTTTVVKRPRHRTKEQPPPVRLQLVNEVVEGVHVGIGSTARYVKCNCMIMVTTGTSFSAIFL